MQLKSKAAESDSGVVDGILGGDTENALKDFQQKMDLQPSQKITLDTCSRLMDGDPPGIFSRCLQLTGDFEGHGFQKIAGNFDDAGLTWGIIFSHEQQRIIRWLKENPAAADRDKRVLIADVVAENCRPKYVEDVSERKRAIATGEGEVQRAKYALRDWRIAEFSWSDTEHSATGNLRIIQ